MYLIFSASKSDFFAPKILVVYRLAVLFVYIFLVGWLSPSQLENSSHFSFSPVFSISIFLLSLIIVLVKRYFPFLLSCVRGSLSGFSMLLLKAAGHNIHVIVVNSCRGSFFREDGLVTTGLLAGTCFGIFLTIQAATNVKPCELTDFWFESSCCLSACFGSFLFEGEGSPLTADIRAGKVCLTTNFQHLSFKQE